MHLVKNLNSATESTVSAQNNQPIDLTLAHFTPIYIILSNEGWKEDTDGHIF